MVDRESRKKQITARRQAQILNAAMEVFSQKGFTAATIPEIAKRAGIAAGTIYIYYKNKRELFVAVIERLMVTPLLGIFQKVPGKDFTLTIKNALKNRLEFIENAQLIRFPSLMSEVQRDPELKTLFMEQLIQPFLSRMENLFRNQIASGEFRQFEPAVIVRAVGGMMIGLTILKSMEGDASPLSQLPQNKVVDELLSFILCGSLNQKRD